MTNRDNDFLNRNDRKKRSDRKQGRKKIDRLLNVLIAIVAVLIIGNLYFIFASNEDFAQTVETENEQTSDSVANNEQNDDKSSEEDGSSDLDSETENSTTDSNNSTSNNSENNSSTNNDSSGHPNDSENTTTVNADSNVIHDSTDPLVEQVIINPNWEVTPTKQTGEHISTYQEGHIDYEEKKLTIQNTIGLTEDNIIYWSIKNNGSSENSIAVVSTKDQEQKYRVSIEWVAQQGWKPVKVEILNQIEETY